MKIVSWTNSVVMISSKDHAYESYDSDSVYLLKKYDDQRLQATVD